MRRLWGLFFCFATVFAVGEALGQEPAGPSLEYRPPRPELPEPKVPTPAPPVAVFKEAIGGLGMSTGAFDRPVDAVFDKNGNLYVLDAGNNRVQRFDRFGSYSLTWGSSGVRRGQFNDPHALLLYSSGDSVYLLVVDTGNHRVQKFQIQTLPHDEKLCSKENVLAKDGDTQICYVGTWGSLGSRGGDFKTPRDITLDRDGNIFVLDAGNDRIQKFDPAGGFISEMGRTFGSRGGVFEKLESVTWSDERFGYLYLLSAGCLVQQFEMDGTLIASWSAAPPESGLCVPARIRFNTKEDYLYILDAGNNMMLRYTRDGRFLTAMRGAERPFAGPLGLSFNTDRGDFVVADTDNSIVQKFTLR